MSTATTTVSYVHVTIAVAAAAVWGLLMDARVRDIKSTVFTNHVEELTSNFSQLYYQRYPKNRYSRGTLYKHTVYIMNKTTNKKMIVHKKERGDERTEYSNLLVK